MGTPGSGWDLGGGRPFPQAGCHGAAVVQRADRKKLLMRQCEVKQRLAVPF